MGQIAGLLWMVASTVVFLGAAVLPGDDHAPIWMIATLSGVVFLYGLASATRLIRWNTASIRTHAIATAATFPVIGLTVYLMGNADAYLEPLLVIPLLYSTFFFPKRIAWVLTALLLLIAGLPLITDPDAADSSFLARYLTLCVAFVAAAWVIIGLRERIASTEQRQREIADTDPLTGIGNRRTFDRLVDRELARRTGPDQTRRDSDRTPLSLLLMDLDDFKSINDRQGHLVGDQVLCAFAEHASRRLRESDTLARMGGDEFAILAPGADHGQAARIARSIEETFDEDDSSRHPWHGVSIGWAVYPVDGEDYESLMRLADERMLSEKHRR